MWTKEIAKIWTNYVPPCRPSRFELDLCAQKIYEFRSVHRIRPRLLILGSTTEFRELGYEEKCEVTIVDNSLEYHQEISKELKYKNTIETLQLLNWQEIEFQSEFDIAVGDLVIGNLKAGEVENFLGLVHQSLTSGGYFLTKSFFYDDSKEIIPPEVFFKAYENETPTIDSFPACVYNLATYCMNEETNILRFYDMFLQVKKCFDLGIISTITYSRFLHFGWQDSFKTEFYVMPKNLWEETASKYFKSIKYNHGPYHWSHDFPFYTLKK